MLPTFHCFLALIILLLWPVLTLADIRTSKFSTLPTNNSDKLSLIFSPASISTDSNSIFSPDVSASLSALSSLNALSTSSKLSKISAPLSGKVSSRDAFPTTNFAKMCHYGKHAVTRISQLMPDPCKHLPHGHKSSTSTSHNNVQSALSKLPSTPSSSEEDFDDHLEPASLSASTSQPSQPKTHNISSQMPHSTRPLFDLPFIIIWNIPDNVCKRLNISLDTSSFQEITTPAKVQGQFLSVFYSNRLGLYPYVEMKTHEIVNGGIPQKVNLKASINKSRGDINDLIPCKTPRGMAVIDQEEWRPLWDRNWGSKKIYQTLSVAHAGQKNLSLTAKDATKKAKQEFEEAAKNFMLETLQTGKNMRPNYLWGFYLFPNCYNYHWNELNYTGECTENTKRQNDELLWLWESSTALYPSVYLKFVLSDNPKAALMVRNRVQEALRVSALPRPTNPAPVFVYTRPVFIDQNKRFLSQTSCKLLSTYLTSILNPYITNVTAAAQVCSNFLCSGNGRCVRKNFQTNHYLHLNPEDFKIRHVKGRYLVQGKPSMAYLESLRMKFKCQCYKGLSCTPRSLKELSKFLNSYNKYSKVQE